MNLIFALWMSLSAHQPIELAPGMVITQSGVVHQGLRLIAPAGIRIKGENITVDFAGATLLGRKDVLHDREALDGTGITIDGCKNVVIKNATVQGFRFNIRVIDSTNVRIEGCDVGFGRAIRMMRNGSPIDTFLVLRDSNAWREYGAGIWIEKSTKSVVEACKASGGTIGLALVDAKDCTVHGCDFSFCGGWGVGMARSSQNTIAWNMLDFNNRVWGGGWGGDSSAMGVADNCDDNFIVGNSMTHGGDGFFLSNTNDVGGVDPSTGFFAPKGGSDRNIIAYNDGSWAPANAFEGTFSDGNVYYKNIANDSGYGFWLGFSTNTLIIENEIKRNRVEGIALEQGKGTKIDSNDFQENAGAAIHLWASPQKERTPFPSTAIDILNNIIGGQTYRLDGSTDVSISMTKWPNGHVPAYPSPHRQTVSGKAIFAKMPQFEALQAIVKTRPAGFRMYAQRALPKGIDWIQPDDYAPRDFRGDLAAWRQVDPGTVEVFLIDAGAKLAPPAWAKAEHVSDRIVRISAGESDGPGEDKSLSIDLVSGAHKQSIHTVLRTGSWNLKWYSWAGKTYEDHDWWSALWDTKPLRAETSRSLGGDWGGRSPAEGVPSSHFALLATSRLQLAAGRYTFNSVSDDGFRLLIDGKVVIDRWNHHGPTPDTASVDLSAGVHEFRVEYCQEDGAAVLRLDWSRQVS